MYTALFPAENTAFGKYQVLRELGRGSMGVVFLAEDQVLGRQIALKVLSPALSMDEDFKVRFRLEARTVASVSHAHVVRVHNLDEIDGLLIIDMEYLEGGDMLSALTRGMSVSEVVQAGAQILDALEACHQRDIIHRDVKPTNILFGQDGHAKVSDFGLAKMLESHLEYSFQHMRSSAIFLGTPRYAPPEAWDAAEPEPTWDVYSTGMVLYEALSGQLPYTATTPMSLIKEMAERDATPLGTIAPGVSDPLARVVDSMISKTNANRPQSAFEARLQLAETPEYHQSGGAAAPTVAAPRPVRRPKVKRAATVGRRAVLFVAAAGLCVVLGVTSYVMSRGSRVAPATPVAEMARALELQSQAFAEHVPGPDAIPLLAKLPLDQWRVYSANLVRGDEHTQGQALWLLTGGRGSLVLIFADSLCVLQPEDLGNRIAVHGHWAQFAGPSGSVLRMGVVGGAMSRAAGDQLIAGTLEFTDERINDRWQMHVQLVAGDDRMTDTAALLEFERAESLAALLYNELLPRGLPWAVEFEARLPALAGARATALEAEDSITVDGALDEAFWLAQPGTGASATIPAIPRTSRARVAVRQSGARLLLGATLPGWTSEQLYLELGVQHGFAVPAASAPRWLFVYDAAQQGRAAIDLRTNETSSAAAFECVMRTGRNAATVEIAIDLAMLAPDEALDRVRLNLHIRESSDAAAPTVVWGWPEVQATEHGALIELPETYE